MSRSPRLAAAKRDWGSDDTGCRFLHVDMDSFFASVELRESPELVGRPVVVGGLGPRSVVSAATYEARAFGVSSAQPMSVALRLCPQAVVLPVRHQLYSAVSRQVMGILGDFTPLVEQVSVDEAFLDVSGARFTHGSPVQVARAIRTRIRSELGLTATVGVAAQKFVSKIASTQAKPDGLLLVPKARTRDFLSILPIGAMWGVGPKAAERLQAIGVRTVGQVSNLQPAALVSLLGQAGARKLTELAAGIDPRGIELERERKSIGKEHTFAEDVFERDLLRRVLLEQADEVTSRLRACGLKAGTVALKVRTHDFTTFNRSLTLPAPTDGSRQVYAVASDLLDRWGLRVPVRLIGTRVENLSDGQGGVQALMFEDARRPQLDSALDAVRGRFGADAISAAELLRRETE